jgi:hypothetical protein
MRIGPVGIQPCSPHSRIAPTSIRTDIAHPSAVRKAGRRSFIVSIEFARETSPLGARRSALLTQGTDSESPGLRFPHGFPRLSSAVARSWKPNQH